MEKTIIAALIIATLSGCSQPPKSTLQDQKYGSSVTIFSANNLMQAQAKADQLCGSHAFFIRDSRSNNEYLYSNVYGIEYQCNVVDAAYYGNPEARKLQHDKEIEAYKNYVKTTEEIKESRRKNADPNKYESYTETDPYGNVRSYNFFNGRVCESTVTTGGTAETHCE
ncbi:hypothetical protein [Klebsiella oxytoca]